MWRIGLPGIGVRQLNQSGATIQQDLLNNWLSRLYITYGKN